MQILKSGDTGRGILIENDCFFDPNLKENSTIIKEAEKDIDNFLINPVVYCPLQKYGVKNANERIYEKEVLYNAVDKYNEVVRKRYAFGEIDHVNSTSVSLRRDSIGMLIEDIYWKSHMCMGKVRIPISRGYKNNGTISCGADFIANLIIEHNALIGISSRGAGEVNKKGNAYYVADYDIICWDWVNSPSTSGSWAYLTQKSAEVMDSAEIVEGVTKEKNNGNPFLKYFNQYY